MKVLIIIIIILAALVTFVVLRSIYELKRLSVSRYDICSPKISIGDELRAVFISDLHGRTYGDKNVQLVNLIKAEKPGVILIGGDLMVARNSGKDLQAREFIEEISGIAPVFYAMGNHEKGMAELKMFRTRYRNYVNFLRRCGIRYLRNETEDINGSIAVTGLDIDYEYYKKIHPKKMEAGEIEKLAGKASQEKFNILLAHSPKYFDRYAARGDDMILSGHYHGGAIRLPLVGGVISPQFRPFPKYSKGRFTKGETDMIVTSGAGSHSINIRVFNKPEIVVLDIHR